MVSEEQKFLSRGERAVARCDRLGDKPFSDEAGLLFRPWLGPGFQSTVETVADWMREAGMDARQDSASNMIGRYEGLIPGAPALLFGSHLDSVRDGGRYDGILGVIAAIEVVSSFHERGERFPFALEIIGFGDEEGSRFPVTMLTTRAVAGVLEEDDPGTTFADLQDVDGVTVAQALNAAGLTARGMARAGREASELIGYVEAHIEQGPALEAEGRAIGVVSGIAAQRRYEVKLHGTAGHAGTMAMALRQDALAAAAEMVLAIEATARAYEGRDCLVATVGSLRVWPDVVNVVPGDVIFTIDVRAGSALIRDLVINSVLEQIRHIADRRGIGAEIIPRENLAGVPCDPRLLALLEAAVADVTGSPARVLVSGAGHDAMIMARLVPMAMLFIRCERGISHNPAEAVRAEDVDIAIGALTDFVRRLAAAENSDTVSKHSD
ncbi:allantoate amidohydrolase [Acetobacter oeni]|uniref:Zn-dependent hydrolase n=1 Tax=Acetobacter oeni TaxID=304077 RepID=A0A511XIA0_9PROT|nr:allantoate amidohydrolase [Acetobacter oeni]MBB3881401.1 allantoate deiminase [Acetobacter oeni]NHO18268.1 allantoate amidohydrolase [Acetobacter oeni]GBR11105.1 allantoate amidohydrolase [Acetobacter oeni LMG 21952]GEN62678.1 Zn-dependent hydrolase [Acetobacter oeni]